MKKFVFFTVALVLSWSYLLNAQCDSTLPISENFNDSNTVDVCWNLVDQDGDGWGWYWWQYSATYGGHKVIASNSFYTSSGALTPDNWIMSHAINLTSFNTNDNIVLSWKVRGELAGFSHERYSIYAATNNQTSAFETSSVKRTEYVDEVGGAGVFVTRSLNLSSLVGNVVYIAFRHHDSTNEYNINIDDVTITANGVTGGCVTDSDNDGVCDSEDQCPGFDDTIDTNNNGIPDGCENIVSCTEQTANFSSNPLTHSGSGSNSTNISLPNNSQDISFTISGINQNQKGKPTSKFIDKVVVTYKDGAGTLRTNGTYSGESISSATINIQGQVQSVTVSLSDGLGGNTDAMSINLSAVTFCATAVTCPLDSDNDGVCDADDQCPGFDDAIDTNNNGIPDGCEDLTGCVENTANFSKNPLEHTGSGFNSVTLNLPPNSQDVLFTISDISEKLKGKESNKYIERVEVSYVNGSGVSQIYNTYSGVDVSSATINIQGIVKSITIRLEDEFSGSTSTNMSISFSPVTFCVNSSAQAKTTSKTSSLEKSMGSIKIYPNPVSNMLYFKGTDLIGTQVNVTLFNMNGTMVRNKDFSNISNSQNEIDINGLSIGLYILQIVDNHGNVLKTDKIIIK